MAQQTDKHYRNQVLYSVFVRNHSKTGTFAGVRQDLDRIQSLGVDILWLLPIHPIGETARKGILGSPYAIRDYRTVNSEYGTMEDFVQLVEEIHGRGMKCIIDVVYNHTAPDSLLAQEHPEWFYHKPDGSFGNRIGDWTDTIDLDYSHRGLWAYQIETLKQWARIVDGFRCDVAALIPLEFWLEARRQVEKVRPGCIWLAESVEPEFIVENRARGMVALSDSEIFQAFDMAYDYDVYGYFSAYLSGKITLARYLEALSQQETIYPANYVKLRCLENHDRARIAAMIPDKQSLENWTAFLYFQKGMTMLYAGQEAADPHRPSLFDTDPVNWFSGCNLAPLLRQLYWLKKDPLFTDSQYTLQALPWDIALVTHQKDDHKLVGLFSLRGEEATAEVNLPDGEYENLLGTKPVEVIAGQIFVPGRPVILRVTPPEEPEEEES